MSLLDMESRYDVGCPGVESSIDVICNVIKCDQRRNLIMPKKSETPSLKVWLTWKVKLQFEGPFAASIPHTTEEIQAMLKNRMPVKKPIDAIPIDVLTERIAEAVGIDEEEPYQPGWSTFLRDEQGLYYEGRCVRGHLKDCAQQVKGFFSGITNFRSQFVNRVYVQESKIHLGKMEPDGKAERHIHVMTQRGPRSTIKYMDYIESPLMQFHLQIMNDNLVTLEILHAVFEYGGIHGMGQDRSAEWGHYKLEELSLQG